MAIIDAMGFRGIWERYDPNHVLNALKNMKGWFEQRIQHQFSTQPCMKCAVAFLSDTIAVSMSLEGSIENREAMSVIYLGDVISWVLDRALRSNFPLAYRGTIAVGNYEISSNFLIGGAIDEAASLHELAQGAFIWLAPQARDYVAHWLQNQPHNTHFVKFDVPLKGGGTFNTYTVSPLEQTRNENDANDLAEKLIGTFCNFPVNVAIKRQNTLKHLQACYKWRNYHFSDELSVLL
ncbi:MAG: hypothetical protein ACRETQ_11075 [Gammaproteobacteria bacterium]